MNFDKLEHLVIGLFVPTDISKEEAEKRVEKYRNHNVLTGNFKELKNKIKFPYAWGVKEIEIVLNSNNFSKINDNLPEPKFIPLSDYKIPDKKDNIFNLDLSWQRLGGKLVIEDWTNLKSLNVGNNEIAELEIRNCPNLIWLNYAHNALTKQEIIEDCPLLTPENTFSEHKGDYIVPDDFVPDTPIHDEVPPEQEEIKEDKTNYDITEEYLDSLTYEELIKLDVDTIPQNLKRTTIQILTNKFKEKQEQAKQAKQEIKDRQAVSSLIAKAKKSQRTNNLRELKAILKELKTYCDTDSYKENKDLIRGLERTLLKHTQKQATSNNNEPLSFVISISVLSVIALTLLAKILYDKIKSYFNKLIKIN